MAVSPRQSHMLRLTIAIGYACRYEPAGFYSTWAVRLRQEHNSPVEIFTEKTGDALVSLGLIAPDPDPTLAVAQIGNRRVMHRFVATRAGVEWFWKSEVRAQKKGKR